MIKSVLAKCDDDKCDEDRCGCLAFTYKLACPVRFGLVLNAAKDNQHGG